MLPKVANEMYCDTKPNWLEGEVGGDFVSAKKMCFCQNLHWGPLALFGPKRVPLRKPSNNYKQWYQKNN